MSIIVPGFRFVGLILTRGAIVVAIDGRRRSRISSRLLLLQYCRDVRCEADWPAHVRFRLRAGYSLTTEVYPAVVGQWIEGNFMIGR